MNTHKIIISSGLFGEIAGFHVKEYMTCVFLDERLKAVITSTNFQFDMDYFGPMSVRVYILEKNGWKPYYFEDVDARRIPDWLEAAFYKVGEKAYNEWLDWREEEWKRLREESLD